MPVSKEHGKLGILIHESWVACVKTHSLDDVVNEEEKEREARVEALVSILPAWLESLTGLVFFEQEQLVERVAYVLNHWTDEEGVGPDVENFEVGVAVWRLNDDYISMEEHLVIALGRLLQKNGLFLPELTKQRLSNIHRCYWRRNEEEPSFFTKQLRLLGWIQEDALNHDSDSDSDSDREEEEKAQEKAEKEFTYDVYKQTRQKVIDQLTYLPFVDLIQKMVKLEIQLKGCPSGIVSSIYHVQKEAQNLKETNESLEDLLNKFQTKTLREDS